MSKVITIDNLKRFKDKFNLQKQDKTDNSLNTTDKTISGAINELEKRNLEEIYNVRKTELKEGDILSYSASQKDWKAVGIAEFQGAEWESITGKPSTFPPSSHDHNGYLKHNSVELAAGQDILTLPVGIYRAIGKNYVNAPPGQENGWAMIIVYRATDYHAVTWIQNDSLIWTRGASGGWIKSSVEGHNHDSSYLKQWVDSRASNNLEPSQYINKGQTIELVNSTQVGVGSGLVVLVTISPWVDTSGLFVQTAYTTIGFFSRVSNGSGWGPWNQYVHQTMIEGRGLWGTCTTVADWNTVISNGFYMGANVANAPSTDWWMGQVIVHNANWIIQRVCNFNSTQMWKTRYKINGTWSAWTNEDTPKTKISTKEPSGTNWDIWYVY